MVEESPAGGCDCECVCKCKAICDDTCSSVCSKDNKYCYDPRRGRPYFTNWFRCHERYCGSPCNFQMPIVKTVDCDKPRLEAQQVILPVVIASYEMDLDCAMATTQFSQVFDGPPVNPPYTFVAGGTSGTNALITGMTIDPTTRDGWSRLRATATFPMTLSMSDASDNLLTGTANVTLPLDILICSPEACDYPFEAQATISAVVIAAEVDPITGQITLTLDAHLEIHLIVVRPCYIYSDGSCSNVCKKPAEEADECVPCYDFWRMPLYPGCGWESGGYRPCGGGYYPGGGCGCKR